jgi:hypothetical protein
MSYKLITPDGRYERRLSNHECRTILREALRNGWRPSSKHLQNGTLRLEHGFDAEEARSLAAAIERSIPSMTKVSPPLVVTMLESISVLRRGGARFEGDEDGP